MKQILLNAKGCSGRGVRIEILTSAQREAIREETAKSLTPTSTVGEWNAKQTDAGIAAMVVAITEKTGFKTWDELVAADVKWKSVSADHLADKRTEYFNTKDLDALAKVFTAWHDISSKELDDILGEARDVTAD